MTASSSGFSPRVSPLLEPIDADPPCGVSMRYDAAFDRLRELRREDDTSLPTGIWSSDPKRADWGELQRLATQILRERSKELMVAVWLGEAWLHKDGLASIVDALALVGGLCERYPDDVHPLPEDGDLEWRAAPLESMVRCYEPLLLARLALFPVSAHEQEPFTLHDWQQMKLRQVLINESKPAKVAAQEAQSLQQKVNERVRNTPLAWWLQGAAAVRLGLAQLVLLEGWCDRYLLDCAPNFAPLRKVMQTLEGLLKDFIALHPPQDFPEPTQPLETEAEMEVPASQPRQPFAEPRNREEAYRQLLVIADYLARSEPHSPVPYLIRRGVEWGNKPLRELLAELIASDAEARRLWTLMGVL
ncbi:type VI secretion system protein TssA [Pseudomonas fontis]|uniref:Type VI secretion system protein TssA n=1 Tax=Pseudomonas fontis TaxID=2942633 RepID=A0ABT5NTV0_9PSED|nr:type VI secretion system protein TssA [Pseudomonas fontis]MDD0974512.1 type VI secretion system protein TssA [Pseudomonas fontis]MDD0991606.1 type VI secretion system protein TssA [Pseudomonas fontis]